MIEKEIWKPITGHKYYYCSNKGRIKSEGRPMLIKIHNVTAIRKTTVFSLKTTKGYQQVVLNGKALCVHKIVAKEFLPNPKNKPCVNHKDGDKLNNNVSNLEWVTHSENTKHAFDTGLMKYDYRNYPCKLNPKIVADIRRLYNDGWSYRNVADLIDIPRSTVYGVVSQRNWKCV